jgi:hypothetical protein
MTPAEREEMNRLCCLIQDEKDPKRFMELVDELNKLFERKEKRLEGWDRSKS